MNISRTPTCSSLIGAFITGCLLSTAVVVIPALPASARDNYRQQDNRNDRRYEHNRRGYERQRYDRNRRVYRPYGYRERVYVPPPVMYAPAPPPPPPGIGIFFPPLFFHL